MVEFSSFRLIGILAGCSALGIAFYRLRSHAPKRGDVFLLTLLGVILILLGLAPDLANLPSRMLALNQLPGGRLITLLLISSFLLWILLFIERGRRYELRRRLEAFFHQVSADHFFREDRAIANDTILILMPALNEAENLEYVLSRMPSTVSGKPLKVLVIDDGSSDQTRGVAIQNGAWVVSHPTNFGGGAALRTGYDIAKRLHVAIVVTMDADGQHDSDEISTLVNPILSDEADMVIGSRVLGTSDKYSIVRSWGVHTFNFIINALMGTQITDCASGFRAMRLSSMQQISLTRDQYHTAELIIEAAKKKVRIVDRPISISRRFAGRSKKGGNIWYALKFLRTVLLTWWR